MSKFNLKTFIFSLFTIVIAFCSLTAEANVPYYLDIVGPRQICVGKTNVQYNLDYYFPGTLDSCLILVYDADGTFIASNTNNQTFVYINAPTNECTLEITANLNYVTNPVTHEGGHLGALEYVYVRKPDLQTSRLGLEGTSYTNALKKVPIHWNIDDDDRSGYGNAQETRSGEDYLQPDLMSCNDDDLYSIRAYIGNNALNTTHCDLKIKTPDSMRLWYSQNKNGLCCDADSVFETNCNIKTWFNNFANSTGHRLYVEWVAKPDITTNEYIEFYCNNVQFAKLHYKGYAFTCGALPNTEERIVFENLCELDGCEWGIYPNEGSHKHDRNSLAEAVDPSFLKYGEPFVVTTSSPFGTNIYVLQDSIYNTFQCRCISMDTFGNQNHTFEDSDATAFFTTNYFWIYNYVNYNTSPALSDILYYSGQFAATKVSSSWLVNCHPSWAMFTSRFFNRPKIIHRAEQLESNRTIQKTYVIELP